ncbi:MAG: iron export ABC transporter permease subunit FetB [Myxococcales bacterium]|nr:iron export ABC transporter permease subunit FetB [Myxococcales bacterium]
MNSTILNITYLDLLFCALMMLIPYLVSRFLSLALETDLLVGTVRVFLQLWLVGYILHWVFSLQSALPVFAVLVVMTVIAGYNAAKRADMPRVRVIVMATGVIGLAAVVLSAYVFYLILGISPYYNPAYVIPIMGMALNGAMNAVSVGARAVHTGMRDGRERIEAALSIGATSWQASGAIVRQALKQAMVPTINGLMTAGIVQLPGMMTGQIISGVSPLLAIRYQVVIFYLLTSVTAIAAIGGTLILSRGYFSRDHQLL